MLYIDPVRMWGCLQTDATIGGAATSGGASLSGIDEPIRTDGGGYVQASFSQGTSLTSAQTKSYRAFTTGQDGGANQFVCMISERQNQPVKARAPWINPVTTGVYASGGAIAHVQTVQNGQTGGLRATLMRITAQLEVPLLGGEWFTITHTTWGDRAYNLVSATLVSPGVWDVEFRPPLREATAAGVFVDFDNPRCTMRLAQAASNQFNWPRSGAVSLSFVEDMRKPS